MDPPLKPVWIAQARILPEYSAFFFQTIWMLSFWMFLHGAINRPEPGFVNYWESQLAEVATQGDRVQCEVFKYLYEQPPKRPMTIQFSKERL